MWRYVWGQTTRNIQQELYSQFCFCQEMRKHQFIYTVHPGTVVRNSNGAFIHHLTFYFIALSLNCTNSCIEKKNTISWLTLWCDTTQSISSFRIYATDKLLQIVIRLQKKWVNVGQTQGLGKDQGLQQLPFKGHGYNNTSAAGLFESSWSWLRKLYV